MPSRTLQQFFQPFNPLFRRRMRTHNIFGKSRAFTVNVFRSFQPAEERKQSFTAAITHGIRVATVLGIFIDIHVSYPADTVNNPMKQFINGHHIFAISSPTKPNAGTNANTMLPIIPNIKAGIRNIP